MGDVKTEDGCISLWAVMRARKFSHPLHMVAVQQFNDAVVLETASLTLVRGIKPDFEISNQLNKQ